ncbi:hypothetical protein KTR10_01940 [Candidatus Kaiserbacteria bacterium]|nr:hypothetical protein [Candidatus Kaiserbacteria bacterium]
MITITVPHLSLPSSIKRQLEKDVTKALEDILGKTAVFQVMQSGAQMLFGNCQKTFRIHVKAYEEPQWSIQTCQQLAKALNEAFLKVVSKKEMVECHIEPWMPSREAFVSYTDNPPLKAVNA